MSDDLVQKQRHEAYRVIVEHVRRMARDHQAMLEEMSPEERAEGLSGMTSFPEKMDTEARAALYPYMMALSHVRECIIDRLEWPVHIHWAVKELMAGTDLREVERQKVRARKPVPKHCAR